MNFKFAEQVNPELEKFDFAKAISIAETALKKIPTTDFHAVLGKSLVGQANSLVTWIDNFYKLASKKLDIKALYFELNEFDINTEMWYIDGFAYNKDGGLNLSDMEWLCKFETDSQTETNTVFTLNGLEKLQTAFETMELDSDSFQDARDWCEQIIIARFMELMRTTHETAKQKKCSWATLPIYFAEHSYDDLIIKS